MFLFQFNKKRAILKDQSFESGNFVEALLQ